MAARAAKTPKQAEPLTEEQARSLLKAKSSMAAWPSFVAEPATHGWAFVNREQTWERLPKLRTVVVSENGRIGYVRSEESIDEAIARVMDDTPRERHYGPVTDEMPYIETDTDDDAGDTPSENPAQ